MSSTQMGFQLIGKINKNLQQTPKCYDVFVVVKRLRSIFKQLLVVSKIFLSAFTFFSSSNNELQKYWKRRRKLIVATLEGGVIENRGSEKASRVGFRDFRSQGAVFYHEERISNVSHALVMLVHIVFYYHFHKNF